MAITYTGTGGLFTRFGKLMHAFLALEAQQLAGTDTIPDLEDDVLAAFADNPELVSGLYEELEQARLTIDNWKQALVSRMELLLPALADELNAPSADASVIWPLFLARLGTDAQTVKANAVALGEIVPATDNSGDGQLVCEIADVDGRLIETLIPESLRVACVGAPAADQESFQISGEVPASNRMSSERNGSGRGDTVNIANGTGNLVTDGDFEAWSADTTPVLNDWDIIAGAPGTNILALTASPFRGDNSLKLLGDGVAGEITISQAFDAGAIAPRTKYVVGCWIKTSGLTAATITIQLAGTGYTVGDRKISITAGTGYQADWTFYSFFVDTPAIIPDDFEITINAHAVENHGYVLVDGLALVPAAVHAGISWAVFAGASRFALGDGWTFSVTNDQLGLFQTMFGRLWGVQLPSDDADGETISDDLITGSPS